MTTTEEARTPGQSLDLRDLHAANIARQAEWCPDQVPDLSFRGNELGGECGEAQNVIKKLERERQGWRGSRATKDDLADELADVVICADLCAVTAGIDLGAAVLRKFNATSEKQGLSVFLPATPAPSSPGVSTNHPDVLKFAGQLVAEIDGLIETTEGIAGLHRNGDVATWEELLPEGEYERLSSFDMLRDALAAANTAGAPFPSSPGVPDSVRALSEAASPDWDTNEGTSYILGPPIDGEIDRFEVIARGPHGHAKSGDAIRKWQANRMFAVAAVKFVRTLISAHPAGQSTGQVVADSDPLSTLSAMVARKLERYRAGKGEPCAWAGGNDTCYCRTCGEEYRYGREDKPACPRKPAPDSTRTGQVGTEDAAKRALDLIWAQIEDKRADLFEEDGYGDGPYRFGDGGKVFIVISNNEARALLAARPAAPEAQGAWLPIETAPKDGSKFDAWAVHPGFTSGMGVRFADVQMRGDGTGFGVVIPRPEAHWEYLEQDGPTFPAWKLTHWRPLPAPPASSGQESAR